MTCHWLIESSWFLYRLLKRSQANKTRKTPPQMPAETTSGSLKVLLTDRNKINSQICHVKQFVNNFQRHVKDFKKCQLITWKKMDNEPIVITDTEINLSVNVMVDGGEEKKRRELGAGRKIQTGMTPPLGYNRRLCIRAASKCTFELSPPDISKDK